MHNLFGRHPELRIVSIENGSRWVKPLLADMDNAMLYTKGAGGQSYASWLGGEITDAPSELFKRHVSVAPFLEAHFEADVRELVDVLGADRVIYGSDWPHGEGAVEPLGFLERLAGLAAADRERIVHGNAAALLGLDG